MVVKGDQHGRMLDVPIIGLIENIDTTCPHCGEKLAVWGKSGRGGSSGNRYQAAGGNSTRSEISRLGDRGEIEQWVDFTTGSRFVKQ